MSLTTRLGRALVKQYLPKREFAKAKVKQLNVKVTKATSDQSSPRCQEQQQQQQPHNPLPRPTIS